MTRFSPKRAGEAAPPPLDAAALEALALGYVARYATTQAKLRGYLWRKLRERGWAGGDDTQGAPTEAIVGRIAALGYIDDAAFAQARAATLGRRGFGERRIGQALRGAGIDATASAPALATAAGQAWESALTFARRRRIGPFAAQPADPATSGKMLAAMLRAGHALDLARLLVRAPPGEVPERDEAQNGRE